MIFSRPPERKVPALPTNDDEEYEYFSPPVDTDEIVALCYRIFETWKQNNLDLFVDTKRS